MLIISNIQVQAKSNSEIVFEYDFNVGGCISGVGSYFHSALLLMILGLVVEKYTVLICIPTEVQMD